jgi:hypothetical protein
MIDKILVMAAVAFYYTMQLLSGRYTQVRKIVYRDQSAGSRSYTLMPDARSFSSQNPVSILAIHGKSAPNGSLQISYSYSVHGPGQMFGYTHPGNSSYRRPMSVAFHRSPPKTVSQNNILHSSCAIDRHLNRHETEEPPMSIRSNGLFSKKDQPNTSRSPVFKQRLMKCRSWRVSELH